MIEALSSKFMTSREFRVHMAAHFARISDEVEGADHFFRDPYMDGMIDTVSTYVKRRLTESTR